MRSDIGVPQELLHATHIFYIVQHHVSHHYAIFR